MTNIINSKRINQITTFLKSLNIKSKRFSELIRTQNISIIKDFIGKIQNEWHPESCHSIVRNKKGKIRKY